MTAGTIALTNGSKNVTGTGTAFTTDTAAADFIIVTVGGTTYSLAVDSVTDDTNLKLVLDFDGPTDTGIAWTNVPYGAQMRLSQQMGNDMSRLMRFYLTDKSNWQKILSGPGDVTIKFPDGSEQSGPSWPALISAVENGLTLRGEIAAGVDLNTLGPDAIGVWFQSVEVNAVASLHYPEASKGGTLEVLPHRQGVMHRYTSQSGKVYLRTPSAQWNGTDGPWSAWGGQTKDLEDQLKVGYTNILIKQMKSGNFWVDVHPDAKIHRINDRVLIGGAADNDGKVTTPIDAQHKDWLELIRTPTTNNSQLVVLSTIGQGAILGGSRTSDFALDNSQGCIGLQGWAINDNTKNLQTAYGAYFEVRRDAGAGRTHGFELDVVNFGSAVSMQPYDMFQQGLTAGAWIASGGEIASTRASAAIAIMNNGSTWEKGIIFHSTSIDGTDGISGSGTAIEMAKGHTVRWMFGSGSLGAAINSSVSNDAASQSLQFTDVGTLFKNKNGRNMLQIAMNQTYVNGLNIVPGNPGTGPTIYADGADTNIDLRLSGKGSGAVDLQGLSIGANAGTVYGYATLKINGTSFKVQLFNV